MIVSRRVFLRGVGGGLLLAGTVGCATDRAGQTGAFLRSTARLPDLFAVPLPIPAVLEPTSTNVFDLVARVGTAQILPDAPTPVLGYHGSFPGPTLRARRGRPVTIRLDNQLPVPTVLHLHGSNTPADSDGFPTDLVLPTGGWEHTAHAGHQMDGMVMSGSAVPGTVTERIREYRYPLDQRAAPLWYHDHRMDFTGPQVWRGLLGMFVVSDDEEDALGLPAGDRDVPLIIADRSFAADGTFSYPSIDPELATTPGVTADFIEGVLGDVITVNGAAWPEHEVDAVRYRFRILNASNARRYELALEPGGTLLQIGSDGGLLAAPVAHTSLSIASAERFDVVIDFAAYPVGSTVTLRNALGSGPTAEVMRFRVARAAPDDSTVPAVLSDLEVLPVPPADRYREWRFTRGTVGSEAGWVVNGLPFDPGRIDADPVLGQVERWRLYSDLHHSVHIHLSPFQVLSRGGNAPNASDAGWKDTIDLRPSEYADIAIRFDNHAGRYLLHCHNLEHEDMAMMAAFQTRRA